jgi:hypothetical protein
MSAPFFLRRHTGQKSSMKRFTVFLGVDFARISDWQITHYSVILVETRFQIAGMFRIQKIGIFLSRSGIYKCL